MLRASIYVLIAITLIIGCDEDNNPVTPDKPSLYTIQLTGLPESVTSPHGVNHDIPFQITVINSATNEVVRGAKVNLAVPIEGGTVMPAAGTTDANGIIEAMYSFTMPSGKSSATLFITADNQSSTPTIDLFGSERPVNLVLTTDAERLFPEDNKDITVNLTASVTNARGIGIAGVQVYYEILSFNQDLTFGSLNPISQTDENGLASTTYHSLGEYGEIIIRCTVDEGDQFEDINDEATIEVVEPMRDGTLILNADSDFIYADQGVTAATVRAVLKDRSNQALDNVEVVFTSNNNGAIMSPRMTDSLGIAYATFSDVGLPSFNALGERAPCEVHAIYEPLGLDVEIDIDIRPQELVDNIVLAAGRASMRAGSGDSTWVRATCYLNEERTQLAPFGTWVNFEVSQGMGSFYNSQTHVGYNGAAEAVYIVGYQVGQATLRAYVHNDIDDADEPVYSNEAYIALHPSTPADIAVTAAPSVLRIGEVGEQSMVIATVIDSFGNPIRDGSALVQFSTTLGTVDPPSAPTDTGRAMAMLRPGVEAGVAFITASVLSPGGELTAETAVSFIAGGGSAIGLTANPNIVDVAGLGLNSQSTLSAEVRDANGNLVEVPTRVVFEIMTDYQPPESGNINYNSPFDSDTSSTSNGIAVATYNSGTLSGSTYIRAYTLDPVGQPTGVETSTIITTASGHPESISVDVNSEGIDAGGGAWSIEVSALVRDEYQNAVVDSVPVYFSILGDDVAVISQGRTGNHGIRGRPTDGVAYATLSYSSSNTFQTATIYTFIRSWRGEMIDSVAGHREIQLPLQQGELELHVNPENWQFNRNGNDDMCDVRVWTILRDGHGVLIDDAPILFGSSRAQFWYDRGGVNRPSFEPFFPDPARRHTGSGNDGETPNHRLQDDDPNGHAVVWLRGDENDFLLDPFTMEVRVQLNARVEGYGDVFSEPQFLVITRND